MKEHILKLNDLLHDGPLEVQGIKLDAKISIRLRKLANSHGYIDVDDLNIEDIYLAVDCLQDLVKLDQDSFTTTHHSLFKAFEQAVVNFAILKAQNTPEELWETIEVMP